MSSKVKPVTHDVQGRPLSPSVSDVLTQMAQNLTDAGIEHANKASK